MRLDECDEPAQVCCRNFDLEIFQLPSWKSTQSPVSLFLTAKDQLIPHTYIYFVSLFLLNK